MIEPLQGMPDGTIGFRASGRVTREEYREMLLPAMRAAAEAGDVRMVFAVGPGFEKLARCARPGHRGRGHAGAGASARLEADRAGDRRRLDSQSPACLCLTHAGRGEAVRPRRARGREDLGRPPGIEG
jgi:hypothetical protein